jgi:hypothetical protein
VDKNRGYVDKDQGYHSHWWPRLLTEKDQFVRDFGGKLAKIIISG